MLKRRRGRKARSIMTGNARRLSALFLLLLAGILAGAQLGKIAPLVGWYQAEAGLTLRSADAAARQRSDGGPRRPKCE